MITGALQLAAFLTTAWLLSWCVDRCYRHGLGEPEARTAAATTPPDVTVPDVPVDAGPDRSPVLTSP